MADTKFDAGAYWKERLGEHFDLTGVGFRRRSTQYNRWVYRLRTEALDELFERFDWTINGKAVLDVGCGTGYFIDHWLRRQAAEVVGVDVTEVSVNRLAEKFATARFYCDDIGEPKIEVTGSFEYISIFDVLYHIVDDRRFEQAVENLSRLCKRNGRVIITDMFGQRTVEVVKHVRNRSLGDYIEIFSKKGFRLLDIKPLFFSLMPPARLASKPAYWLGTLGWEALTFLARWSGPGNAIGGWLYKVDSKLRRRFDRGPSHHMAVFEYIGDGQAEG